MGLGAIRTWDWKNSRGSEQWSILDMTRRSLVIHGAATKSAIKTKQPACLHQMIRMDRPLTGTYYWLVASTFACFLPGVWISFYLRGLGWIAPA